MLIFEFLFQACNSSYIITYLSKRQVRVLLLTTNAQSLKMFTQTQKLTEFAHYKQNKEKQHSYDVARLSTISDADNPHRQMYQDWWSMVDDGCWRPMCVRKNAQRRTVGHHFDKQPPRNRFSSTSKNGADIELKIELYFGRRRYLGALKCSLIKA